VLRSSIETVTPLARAKSIEVRPRIDFESATVFGEPDRLQQVFINLLSNAVRFTQEGGNVEARLSRGGESSAEVTVTDDGRGIDEEFISYVFERFRRADACETAGREGLGLGLYIARKLVEMHEGTISAQSPGEGLGATFTVRLPLEEGS
jgi:signal transduction histidine kinase